MNKTKGSVSRFFLSLMIGAGLLGISAPSGAEGERKYGKTLVEEYEVSPETLEKFAAFEASAPKKGESAIVNSLLADSEDWVAPPVDVDATKNPYTVVVTISGTAKADGDAATLWTTGWEFDGGMKRLVPLAGLSKPSAKAGETFTVTAIAAPTSFKESQSVSIALGLVNARNVDIESVKIALWSGVGDASFLEALGPFHWALVGLVMLVLVWLFGRNKQSSL